VAFDLGSAIAFFYGYHKEFTFHHMSQFDPIVLHFCADSTRQHKFQHAFLSADQSNYLFILLI
jgi:hypothetical protein